MLLTKTDSNVRKESDHYRRVGVCTIARHKRTGTSFDCGMGCNRTPVRLGSLASSGCLLSFIRSGISVDTLRVHTRVPDREWQRTSKMKVWMWWWNVRTYQSPSDMRSPSVITRELSMHGQPAAAYLRPQGPNLSIGQACTGAECEQVETTHINTMVNPNRAVRYTAHQRFPSYEAVPLRVSPFVTVRGWEHRKVRLT